MNPSSRKRIISGLISYALALVGLIAAVYVLTVVPIPRQFGLIFRQEIYILPFVVILVMFTFSIQSPFLKRIGYAFLIAFFFIPFSGLLNSGTSDQYILGGTIPWSDAFTNHINALRFLYGGEMGQSTALRPISAVFYDLILYISGNNFLALQLTVTLLIGVSVILLVQKIETGFSGIAALFVYCNAFFYVRRYIGTFMTEPVGFILGNLALYFFLKAIFDGKQQAYIFACFLLSLSLNARPGPMLVLATAGLWYFFRFAKYERRRFLLAALALLAMAAGFAINELSARIVTNNAKLVNRQFAEFVYGMCLGGKSGYETMFMSEMSSLDTSPRPTAELIGLCREAIRENPANPIRSIVEIFKVLIFDPVRGAFSYFDGGNALLISALRYLSMTFWLGGVGIAIRKRKKPLYAFFLAVSLGFLLSQLIAPPFAAFRMRYHAGVIAFPAILAALPFEFAYVRYLKKGDDKKTGAGSVTQSQTNSIGPDRFAAIISTLLTILICVSPFLIRANPLRPPEDVPELRCARGESRLFTRIDPGAYFYMIHRENLRADHYPNFRLAYVRQEFHNSASIEMFGFTDLIDEETAVFRGLDFDTYQDALVFAPLPLVRGKEGYAQLCGTWIEPPILRNDRFFIATGAVFLSDLEASETDSPKELD